MKFNVHKYIIDNPWEIVNLSSINTRCGRYPNKEKAVEQAQTYRGGVVSINDEEKRVYVSEIPHC